jgi:hypothetical protein
VEGCPDRSGVRGYGSDGSEYSKLCDRENKEMVFHYPRNAVRSPLDKQQGQITSKTYGVFMSLKYETIEAAALGDESAVNEVLLEYEPLMLFLSIIVRRDANGKQEKVFSEDAFQMLRQKLIEELPNWKEQCK